MKIKKIPAALAAVFALLLLVSCAYPMEKRGFSVNLYTFSNVLDASSRVDSLALIDISLPENWTGTDKWYTVENLSEIDYCLGQYGAKRLFLSGNIMRVTEPEDGCVFADMDISVIGSKIYGAIGRRLTEPQSFTSIKGYKVLYACYYENFGEESDVGAVCRYYIIDAENNAVYSLMFYIDRLSAQDETVMKKLTEQYNTYVKMIEIRYYPDETAPL